MAARAQQAPRRPAAIGGRCAGIEDNREIPDTLEVLWDFAGPTLVVFCQYNGNAAPGNARNSEIEEVAPEQIGDFPTGYAGGQGYGNPVKTRGKCNADVLTGHLSTSSTLIGNIAHRRRAMLEWDGRAERFTNDPRANELLHYKYRPRRVCQGENSPAAFSPPGGACVWAARLWGGSRCT